MRRTCRGHFGFTLVWPPLSLHMTDDCLTAGLDIHISDVEGGSAYAAMLVESLELAKIQPHQLLGLLQAFEAKWCLRRL
jgi:hypothetical protein